MRRLVLYSVLAVLLGNGVCYAHGSHPSTLKIIRSQGNSSTLVSVSTHLSELRRATPAPLSNLDYAFRQRLRLRLDGRPFKPQNPRLITDPANDFITWQAIHTGPGHQIEVLDRLYPEKQSSELTVAVFENGRIVEQTTLNNTLHRMVWNERVKEKTPSVMHSVTESVSGFMQPLRENINYSFSLLLVFGLILLITDRIRQRRR